MPDKWYEWLFLAAVTVAVADIFIVPTIKGWFKK